MSVLRILVLLTLTFLLISCGKKDEIKPAFAVGKIKSSYDFNYPFHVASIEEFGKEDFRRISVIGGDVQNVVQNIGDAMLEENDGKQDLSPIFVDIPELASIDFRVMKNVTLKEVQLKIIDTLSGKKANLKFIKGLQVYLHLERFDDEKQYEADKNALLIIDYNQDKGGKLECSNKCLTALINNNVDWREIFTRQTSFIIRPILKLNNVPRDRMKIQGQVDFSVELDVHKL